MHSGPATSNPNLLIDLSDKGWAVDRAFLSADEAVALQTEAQQLNSRGLFKPGVVDRVTNQGISRNHVDTNYRQDLVYYLGHDTPKAIDTLGLKLLPLMHGINRARPCYVQNLHAHYAIWPAGSVCARHMDASATHNPTRSRISFVIYLNPIWNSHDFGELCLYTPEGEVLIPPLAGTCVLFLSESQEHSIITPARDRWSIHGRLMG